MSQLGLKVCSFNAKCEQLDENCCVVKTYGGCSPCHGKTTSKVPPSLKAALLAITLLPERADIYNVQNVDADVVPFLLQEINRVKSIVDRLDKFVDTVRYEAELIDAVAAINQLNLCPDGSSALNALVACGQVDCLSYTSPYSSGEINPAPAELYKYSKLADYDAYHNGSVLTLVSKNLGVDCPELSEVSCVDSLVLFFELNERKYINVNVNLGGLSLSVEGMGSKKCDADKVVAFLKKYEGCGEYILAGALGDLDYDVEQLFYRGDAVIPEFAQLLTSKCIKDVSAPSCFPCNSSDPVYQLLEYLLSTCNAEHVPYSWLLQYLRVNSHKRCAAYSMAKGKMSKPMSKKMSKSVTKCSSADVCDSNSIIDRRSDCRTNGVSAKDRCRQRFMKRCSSSPSACDNVDKYSCKDSSKDHCVETVVEDCPAKCSPGPMRPKPIVSVGKDIVDDCHVKSSCGSSKSSCSSSKCSKSCAKSCTKSCTKSCSKSKYSVEVDPCADLCVEEKKSCCGSCSDGHGSCEGDDDVCPKEECPDFCDTLSVLKRELGLFNCLCKVDDVNNRFTGFYDHFNRDLDCKFPRGIFQAWAMCEEYELPKNKCNRVIDNNSELLALDHILLSDSLKSSVVSAKLSDLKFDNSPLGNTLTKLPFVADECASSLITPAVSTVSGTVPDYSGRQVRSFFTNRVYCVSLSFSCEPAVVNSVDCVDLHSTGIKSLWCTLNRWGACEVSSEEFKKFGLESHPFFEELFFKTCRNTLVNKDFQGRYNRAFGVCSDDVLVRYRLRNSVTEAEFYAQLVQEYTNSDNRDRFVITLGFMEAVIKGFRAGNIAELTLESAAQLFEFLDVCYSGEQDLREYIETYPNLVGICVTVDVDDLDNNGPISVFVSEVADLINALSAFLIENCLVMEILIRRASDSLDLVFENADMTPSGLEESFTAYLDVILQAGYFNTDCETDVDNFVNSSTPSETVDNLRANFPPAVDSASSIRYFIENCILETEIINFLITVTVPSA